jgi:thiamine-phosphate pyrophosphorylase
VSTGDVHGAARRERLARARIHLVAGSPTGGTRWLEAALLALGSGAVDVVQLREPDADDRTLLALTARLKSACGAAGALLVVNDRVALAAAADADGAHVGEHDLAPRLARMLLGGSRLLGLSTHDAADVAAARSLPVDYVGLGPCFATGSKALARAPGGPALVLAAVPAAGPLPVFAIGGVTLENAPSLVAAGARRLAVGSAVLRAADPAAAARALANCLTA